MIKQKNNILKVKKLAKDVELPEYALESDVALDLRANEDVVLQPFEPKAIKTGIIIEIPSGCVGLIRDRAGVLKDMNVHSSAGTFDSSYRGEVSIVMMNEGEESMQIEKGMRIAQLLIVPVVKVKVVEVKEVSSTLRGKRSFGSTGLKGVIKELDALEKMAKKK
jgi:dUTP pyrophosphatase